MVSFFIGRFSQRALGCTISAFHPRNHSNNEVYASGRLSPFFFHLMSLLVLSLFFIFVLDFPFKMVNYDKCLTVLSGKIFEVGTGDNTQCRIIA